MPEADDKIAKDFAVDTPQQNESFFLKGCSHLDWGMKNRLASIFNPDTGRTVMLAFDHGYFQGPTTGLERVDVNIVPLAPYADTLMLTRGIAAHQHPADLPRRHRAARDRRAEHPEGALRRGDRDLARGRDPTQRRRAGGAGLHRRRARDQAACNNMTRLIDRANPLRRSRCWR